MRISAAIPAVSFPKKEFIMKPNLNFDIVARRLRESRKRRRVAVALPKDGHTMDVVTRCLDERLADFVLVGDDTCAAQAGRLATDYDGHVEVCTATSAEEVARTAVAAVREHRADVLMKGTMNTDVLLKAVLDKQCGLLGQGRVLSHVTLADIPAYDKLLLFADAAVVPRPTTEQFEAIVGYATDIFRRLHDGQERPHVALIHCTEKTNAKFPHTLSYDEIKRMAADGRFGNAVVDGPMDVKTACDAESGKMKGICSPVAGKADILVFPNIESGNTFYKTITLFAGAQTAGMLCGTVAPVVVASRADSAESKYRSLLLACAMA